MTDNRKLAAALLAECSDHVALVAQLLAELKASRDGADRARLQAERTDAARRSRTRHR